MPLTRSQATPNTRSTRRAIVPRGIKGLTRVKKRKVTSKPSSSKSTNSTTAAQQPDDWKTKLFSVLWQLAEKCRPWLTIVLEAIKSKYPNTVSLIIALTLVVFVIILRWHDRSASNSTLVDSVSGSVATQKNKEIG